MEQIQQPNQMDQYRLAYASLRAAKNWFWWLMLLAVLINLGTYIAVRCWRVLDRSPGFRQDLAELRIAQEPPAGPAAQPAQEQAETSVASEGFYQTLNALLPIAQTLGLVCSLLLVLSMLLSVSVALVGRLDGVGHLTSALVWSIVLAALFVPWEAAFPGVIVPGVLFGRGELIVKTAEVTWGAADVAWNDQVLHFARFVGYPLLALVLWLAVQVKYTRAFHQAGMRIEKAPAPQEV